MITLYISSVKANKKKRGRIWLEEHYLFHLVQRRY